MTRLLLVCSFLLGGALQAAEPSPHTANAPAQVARPPVAGLPVARPTRMQESELDALARIEHELALIKLSIAEAQSRAQGTRLQFDYDALRLDIDRIRFGIRAHRIGELAQPREIEPLQGDYR
jgi:RAQPRD family integrative conjugative element protein